MNKIKFNLTEKYLIEEYINKNLSILDISKNIGCSYDTVKNKLKKFKIKHPDIIGKKFLNWTVIKNIGNPKIRSACLYECICNCGFKRIMRKSHLIENKSNSCKKCRIWPSNLKSRKSKNKNWTGYKELSGTFWFSIKESARKRKIPFNLTIQEVWELYIKQNKKCALSGIDIYFSPTLKEQKEKGTVSLDRIDSKGIYCINNVQWVHKKINNMKQNLDEKEFIEFCKIISEYNK